jgi:hypothetical protein
VRDGDAELDGDLVKGDAVGTRDTEGDDDVDTETLIVLDPDTDAVLHCDTRGDVDSEIVTEGEEDSLGDTDPEMETVRVRVGVSKPDIVDVRLKDFVDVQLSEEDPDGLENADCVAERRTDDDIVGDCDDDRVRDGEAVLEGDVDGDVEADTEREMSGEAEFVTDME